MQPDTTFSAEELKARVAEAMDVAYYGADGTEKAQPPADTRNLDIVERAIRDGLEMFYSGEYIDDRGRPRIHVFSFLRPRVSITLAPEGDGALNIAGDSARYRLPWYVGGAPDGPWRIRGSGADYLVQTGSIDAFPDSQIAGSGLPRMVAVIPLPATGSEGQAWEMRVWPNPSSAFTCEASFRAAGRLLHSPDQKHIGGFRHNQHVLACCIWAGKKRAPEPEQRELARAEYERAMRMAVEIDLANAALDLGTSPTGDESIAAPWAGGIVYGQAV